MDSAVVGFNIDALTSSVIELFTAESRPINIAGPTPLFFLRVPVLYIDTCIGVIARIFSS